MTNTPARGAGRLRWVPAIAVTAATLPYLGLKVLWLSGRPVGADPAVMAQPTMMAFNAATVVLELAAIGLAVALAARWGRRLPAVFVLLPGWVATGLLVPITVVALPAAVLAGPTASSAALAGWVRPVVYLGFAVQAGFLLAAFVGHARRRWSGPLRDGLTAPGAEPLRRSCTGVGGLLVSLSLVLLVGHAVLAADPASWWPAWIAVATATAGPMGALAVAALGAGRRSWPVVVAAWVGSSVPFSTGLWSAVITLGAFSVAGPATPALGLGQLAGLLGGSALAVAALLAVTSGSPDDSGPPGSASRTSVSKQERVPV